MYQLGNDVLATLQAGITAADLSITLAPLAGTSFVMPPAPTDSAVPTYGAPYGIFALVDRLDPSRAKMEIVIYSARAAAGGGAFTYTIPAGGRGRESSTAQAWPPGSYAIQVASADVLAGHTSRAVLRGQSTLVHARDGVMNWDGSSLFFTSFLVRQVGRGKHFGTNGGFLVVMPANGTAIPGFGGHAGAVVAAGGIPISAVSSLWYEPPINGIVNSLSANFRLVATSADFIVPAHWIFIALSEQVSVAGEAVCRVGNGATLMPWRLIGGSGEPAFQNAWVNFGGSNATAAYQKGPDQIVRLRGLVKTGTMNAVIFTLPAGYRPSASLSFAVVANGGFGYASVISNGDVTAVAGSSSAYFSLDNITFKAEN